MCEIRSEQDLQRQVSLLRSQLRDLRMSNDSNQAKLLDHSSRQGVTTLFRRSMYGSNASFLDQQVVSKLAEMDMIVADLERANSRVATVERRNVRQSDVLQCIHLSHRCRSFYVPKLRLFGVAMTRAIGVSTSICINDWFLIGILDHSFSVKDLEQRMGEFETETERLSRALETQRLASSEEEISLNKKIEDISKEFQRKVNLRHLGLL
jgi:homeobox protein cut-like